MRTHFLTEPRLENTSNWSRRALLGINAGNTTIPSFTKKYKFGQSRAIKLHGIEVKQEV